MRQILFVISFVFLLTASPGQALAADSVLLTSGEWPPFYSEHLPYGGVANRVISESFKLVGMDVEYDFVPWGRAIYNARFGPAAGSAGWLRTPAREKHFLYSEPVFFSRRVFFHRKGMKFDWETLDDIKDMRVAVTLGSAEEFPFDEVMDKGSGKIDIAYSYDSGMRKLAAGRVDLYACNLDVGLHVLQHQVPAEEAEQLTYHQKYIFSESNHLIISKRLRDAQALMDRFNEGLRLLRKNGQYTRSFHDPAGREPLQ